MTLDLDVAIRVLRFMTPISATLAFVTVTLGLATSAWLFSEEKIPNPKFNRTGDPDLEFLSKYTSSGLWTLCFTNRESTAVRVLLIERPIRAVGVQDLWRAIQIVRVDFLK